MVQLPGSALVVTPAAEVSYTHVERAVVLVAEWERPSVGSLLSASPGERGVVRVAGTPATHDAGTQGYSVEVLEGRRRSSGRGGTTWNP